MWIKFFLSSLWVSLILRKIYVFKIMFSCKTQFSFLTLAAWWSTGYKYLTKHHLNYSLPIMIWTNVFLNCLIFLVIWYNFYQLWGSCFEILVLWFTIESIMLNFLQETFCIFWYNRTIDSLKYIINITLINNHFILWGEIKGNIFCFIITFLFL